MGVQENLAWVVSHDTGLTVRGRERRPGRAGQRMKRNFLSFLIARERIYFDCKVITWLTFRTNAAVSNPGEAL
jgi:hypothetical protein